VVPALGHFLIAQYQVTSGLHLPRFLSSDRLRNARCPASVQQPDVTSDFAPL
jgi:hypothetical protein